MSKSPVYGRQVTIQYSVNGGQSFVPICEVENFSFKMDDEVKKNSVLGEAGIGSIDVLDMGGTLSFETKKRDTKALAYFINQTRQIRAGSGGDIAGISGVRGREPYFSIVRKITYTDGEYEELTFGGVKLHNYGEDSNGNNTEVSEKFEGTFTRTSLNTTASGDADTAGTLAILKTGVANIGVTNEPDESPNQQLFSESFTGL